MDHKDPQKEQLRQLEPGYVIRLYELMILVEVTTESLRNPRALGWKEKLARSGYFPMTRVFFQSLPYIEGLVALILSLVQCDIYLLRSRNTSNHVLARGSPVVR
jgi:hypothetical protein